MKYAFKTLKRQTVLINSVKQFC